MRLVLHVARGTAPPCQSELAPFGCLHHRVITHHAAHDRMGRCFSRYRFDDAIACLSPASDVIQRTVRRRSMLPEPRGRHGSCAGSREGCASRTRVMRFFADESSPGPSGFADNPPGARYLKPTSPASAKFCQPEGPRVRSLLPPAASLYANFRGGLDHLHAADLFNRKRRSRAGSETISPSWLLPSAGPRQPAGQMSVSAFISARCSTAISAATNGSTSRWSPGCQRGRAHLRDVPVRSARPSALHSVR